MYSSTREASAGCPFSTSKLKASVITAMIMGQMACSASRSIMVSSLKLTSMLPFMVAPIAFASPRAIALAEPLASCSTPTKAG